MKVAVVQGRRYAAGVVVPFFVPENVIGTELLKADSLGWTNAIAYKKGEDPWGYPGDHSHVLVATRSGPSTEIDTNAPEYAGRVVWLKEAYPDMPMPTDPTKPPQQVATDGIDTKTAVAAGGLVLGLGLLGVLFLAGYARI